MKAIENRLCDLERRMAKLETLEQPEQNDERFVNGGLPMGGMGFKVVNEIAQPKQDLWDTTDMAHRAGGLSMEQEPVAWMTNSEQDTTAEYMFCHVQTPMHDIPLYIAPPKREWVGLTDEEEIELDEKYGDDFNAYIDARDAKLKEKNT